MSFYDFITFASKLHQHFPVSEETFYQHTQLSFLQHTIATSPFRLTRTLLGGQRSTSFDIMRPILHRMFNTLLLASLTLSGTTASNVTQPAAGPTAVTPTIDPLSALAPGKSSLHCFQCEGVSTDPDDHCTDSGWISIPRTQRVGYRYLCPRTMDDFCMKTIERWESTRPGVADKFRTRRGCSAKTRTR